ncbi:hypothetical protein ACELLULO517_23650 [Acidisoma cellulosilytica]|uniref:Uncharacterized protein n=1 Tax=Acidisoma cellulosilyticum TaxID=2802395 RepID=A0A963Z701_9PROT|nr:hypothetical protein [Acidisoma cellulosilyticum]MCB8883265.1 hypothetical protein [Acidisoma cellulosilyticum]
MWTAITRIAGLTFLGIGLASAPAAFAQSSSNNPAATVNGTVPTSEGNVWGGADHQPTEADVPQGTMQQQDKINRKLQKLDKQLLNDPLPKVPNGAPQVSGTN